MKRLKFYYYELRNVVISSMTARGKLHVLKTIDLEEW